MKHEHKHKFCQISWEESNFVNLPSQVVQNYRLGLFFPPPSGKKIIIYPSVGKFCFPNRDSSKYFSARASAEIAIDESRFSNRTPPLAAMWKSIAS